MASVLISCPTSGGLVPAGIDCDSLEELEVSNVLAGCPGCNAEHEWTPVEAVLVVGSS